MAHIYIVDDSKIQVLILQKLLSKAGYKVQTFSNGFDLLSSLSLKKPHLIISDIEMPKINGFELIEKVRNDLSDSDIPFLFISSHSDAETMEKADRAGADLFLKKPINTKTFLHFVQSQLNPAQITLN